MDMRKMNKIVFNVAMDLLNFMESVDFYSYDWYDIWTTRIGDRIQKIRYSGNVYKKHLTLPFFLPLYLIGKGVPELIQPIAKKTKAATSMGLVAQSYFILHELTKKKEYLSKGEKVLDWLIANQSIGHSGACWGLPFDWGLAKGVLVKKGTPCSTIMTYVIDAFLQGYRSTKKEIYMDTVTSSGNFLVNDLNYDKITENITCASYTPIDMFHIINSNSFIAAALYRIYNLTKNEELRRIADELINYVLTEQNEDGSWYYWGSQERFHKGIDSLHQCYIIEDLFYCYKKNKNGAVKKSIDKGIKYFESSFPRDDFLISKFPNSPNYLELIDQAESISMFIALGKTLAAQKIIESTLKYFKVKDKPYFYSAIAKVRKIRVPYIRWGQSQMLLALLSFLSSVNNRD